MDTQETKGVKGALSTMVDGVKNAPVSTKVGVGLLTLAFSVGSFFVGRATAPKGTPSNNQQ